MPLKNQNRGESYMGSPDWIKNKKAAINPIEKKKKKKKIINSLSTL